MTTINLRLAQALFPTLTVALLSTACSDSTGPSDGDGVSAPSAAEVPGGAAGTRGAAAPAEPAAGSPVLRTLGANTRVMAQLSSATSATGSYTRAFCQGGYDRQSLRVPTVAGVPFTYTNSGATQRVWFRANFWSQASNGAITYLGSSEWFYTLLAPGQQSTALWYRATTGQLASWETTKSVLGINLTKYFASGEYRWEQNGRVVASQNRRGYHLAGGIALTGGNLYCHWPIL